MSKVIKNTILNYISCGFNTEFSNEINLARVNVLNDYSLQNGNVVYLCEREIRVKDNFALNFAIQKSKELNRALKIIHPKVNYEYKPKQVFIDKQIEQAEKLFRKVGLDFQVIDEKISNFLNQTETALLVIDFNPIAERTYLKNIGYKIYEIDGHNIIPAGIISDKQEYSAATLRKKIYNNIYSFLTEFENFTTEKVEADCVLDDFIENKLQYYADFKNNPSKNVLSGLSKYLNLGFISSQRVALEIIKSDVADINKEIFLEELIVRKELSDNFCLYTQNFRDFSGIPNWAKISLQSHKTDLRAYVYLPKDLESAKTHDKLWNAAQNQLIREGTIHGYLRMYWAKKILEWCSSPEIALDTLIYMNDKYAYDSPSSNGYTGILWAIGGLHDRAFNDYPVTGKIRRMTYDSLKRKCNLSDYIQKYTFS